VDQGPRSTAAEQVGFPYAAQAWCSVREVFNLDGSARSCETVCGLTSASVHEAGPARLLDLARASGGSRTACTGFAMSPSTRTAPKSAPDPHLRVMATLRNLAIGVLRLAGAITIAAGLRWAAHPSPGACPAGPVTLFVLKAHYDQPDLSRRAHVYL
jgi:hypothetical protein